MFMEMVHSRPGGPAVFFMLDRGQGRARIWPVLSPAKQLYPRSTTKKRVNDRREVYYKLEGILFIHFVNKERRGSDEI